MLWQIAEKYRPDKRKVETKIRQHVSPLPATPCKLGRGQWVGPDEADGFEINVAESPWDLVTACQRGPRGKFQR